MADAALEWKGDFSLTPAGDLALVDGGDLTRQRIERRLFTAVQGYLWHPAYGAGLPQRIGRVAREREIGAIARGQIALEASVAQVPVPVIKVTESTVTTGLFVILIAYTDAVTGVAVQISLEVPGTR